MVKRKESLRNVVDRLVSSEPGECRRTLDFIERLDPDQRRRLEAAIEEAIDDPHFGAGERNHYLQTLLAGIARTPFADAHCSEVGADEPDCVRERRDQIAALAEVPEYASCRQRDLYRWIVSVILPSMEWELAILLGAPPPSNGHALPVDPSNMTELALYLEFEIRRVIGSPVHVSVETLARLFALARGRLASLQRFRERGSVQSLPALRGTSS